MDFFNSLAVMVGMVETFLLICLMAPRETFVGLPAFEFFLEWGPRDVFWQRIKSFEGFSPQSATVLWYSSLEWNFSFPKLNCSSLVLAGERFPPLSHAAGKLRIVRKSSAPLNTSQTKSARLGRTIFALSIPQRPLNTAPLPTGAHITYKSI